MPQGNRVNGGKPAKPHPPVIASSTPAGGGPALDETGVGVGWSIARWRSARGRRSMVLESPLASCTRGASKTPTGARGVEPRSTLARLHFVRGPHAGGTGVEETEWK